MGGGVVGGEQQFHSLDVQSLLPQTAATAVQMAEVRRTTSSGLLPQTTVATNQPPAATNPPPVAANPPPVAVFVGDRILPRPKPLPPSYEEAVNTGHVIRDSRVSTIYSPHYGAPIYPCDHRPSEVCYNCIETVPRRRPDSRVWRVRRQTVPLRPQQPVWVKISFFFIMFTSFLVIFAITYNLLVVETFFWYDGQTPSSTPIPWHLNRDWQQN